MDKSIYTSSFACDRIAERHVRDLGTPIQRASKLVEHILMPFDRKLGFRKSLVKGALKGICKNIIQRLEDEKVVIDVFAEALHNPLSPKEAYDIRFVMAMGGRDMIEFVVGQLMLTRREASITITTSDFHVHRHALSRYMQRELKSPKEFFKTVVEPMIASVVIGPASTLTDTDSNNVALPMGDGLLMGRVDLIDTPASLSRIAVGATPGPNIHSYPRANSLENQRAVVRMLTYVDRDSMTDSRTALHKDLCDYIDNHGENARDMFNSMMFVERTPNDEEKARLHPSIRKAYIAAYELVNRASWQHFVKTARNPLAKS